MQNFPFVVSDGPKVPKDPAVRTLIRRQAMRDVAVERKKRGNYGKVNLRQTPTIVQEWSSDSSGSSSTSPESETEIVTRRSPSFEEYAEWFWDDMQIILPNPLSPYDALRSKYKVDLQDLSGLAGFNVTFPAVTKLADPATLKTLLGHQHITYLQYIPARYGSSLCITATVDCLMAKFASRLQPGDGRLANEARSLYANALREVQSSIGDKKLCRAADTLCAVQLLSVYELLDSTKEAAWQQHIAGAEQLIRHRKAQDFTSDFDKALLYGHLGPTVMEAFASNTHCYLESPEWQRIYLSFIDDGTWLTNRSSITVRTRLAEVFLPGDIVDVDNAVTSEAVFDRQVAEPLYRRIKEQQKNILGIMDDYKAHLITTSLLQPPKSELDYRREILGGLVEHLASLKRLMAILNDSERIRLEVEVQSLARLLQQIQTQPSPEYAWLFQSHELGVVGCVQITRELWEEDVSHKPVAEQRKALITRWKAFHAYLGNWGPSPEPLDAALDGPIPASALPDSSLL